MSQKIPQHVVIIMDGNGRWAKDKGLPRTDGHREGVNAIKPILRSCVENRIPFLSIWAFSQDNWSRPSSEVEYLLNLFINSLDNELDELHNSGIRLKFLGDRSKLSSVLCNAMRTAEDLTKNNSTTTLNVLINYTGRWDLTQAFQSIAENISAGELKSQDITEELISSKLTTANFPEPDLFIRTSGEKRISNFFLWQLAYTELYFTDIAWPNFTREEFEKALLSFSNRERRFGKTSDQLMDTENV